MTRLAQICRKLAARQPPDLAVDAPVNLAQAWPAAFFGLDRTDFWAAADADTHEAVVRTCAAGLLVEALGIERTAMDYCASRILTTDDPVEKQVYAFTAADEARHYHWLAALAGPTLTAAEPDAFTHFLRRLVEGGSALALSYLLQIILEGWGIHHYQQLEAHAQDARLAAVMAGIARDEALHYAAGVAHFDAAHLGPADRAFIREALVALCTLLACGPLSVLGVVERAAGGFDAQQRRATFDALQDRPAIQQRLNLLARYIGQAGMEQELAMLESQGLLTVMPSEAALALYGEASETSWEHRFATGSRPKVGRL